MELSLSDSLDFSRDSFFFLSLVALNGVDNCHKNSIVQKVTAGIIDHIKRPLAT